MSAPRFVDDRHALYVGWLLGLAMREGLPVEPVLDDVGNYTDRIHLRSLSDHVTIEVVVPYPPDDWHLLDEVES